MFSANHSVKPNDPQLTEAEISFLKNASLLLQHQHTFPLTKSELDKCCVLLIKIAPASKYNKYSMPLLSYPNIRQAIESQGVNLIRSLSGSFYLNKALIHHLRKVEPIQAKAAEASKISEAGFYRKKSERMNHTEEEFNWRHEWPQIKD